MSEVPYRFSDDETPTASDYDPTAGVVVMWWIVRLVLIGVPAGWMLATSYGGLAVCCVVFWAVPDVIVHWWRTRDVRRLRTVADIG